MTDAKTLTNERKHTHGDWKTQAGLSFRLKEQIRNTNRKELTAYQAEAIDMILVKISRIVCGNPDDPDHWDDIAGYSYLGKGGHDGGA